MVSALALTYASLVLSSLSLSLSLSLSQVLAIHSEAEKEKSEAKRKITKLEDALRYSEKAFVNQVLK